MFVFISQPVKRKREGERRITQEDMLLEAAQTGKIWKRLSRIFVGANAHMFEIGSYAVYKAMTVVFLGAQTIN